LRRVAWAVGLAALAACRTASIPAFPGAEGFGTDTPGGRGGRVIAVTTLADGGPGSLREALTAKGPRIVVFRVGGTIALKSHLHITEPYITVAGQTAPGGGILIRDAGLYVDAHDVVLRHLRVRIGASTVEEYNTQDPIRIEGTAHHVVVDHCSFSWSIDECASARGPGHDITYQWCIIGEALKQPFPKEMTDNEDRSHSMGMILGGNPDRCTTHHNLILHNNSRNPRIQGGLHDVRNNLVYHWRSIPAMFSRNPRVNFIGNYYKPGPETWRKEAIWTEEKDWVQVGTIYVKGNRTPRRPSDDLPEWALTCSGPPEGHEVKVPFPAPPVRTTTAEEAYAEVLAKAGATRPKRDAVDERLINDVRNGTGKLIDRPEEVGGFPVIEGGEAPPDADGDGMPDAWERERGLDPANPKDAAADRDGDRYTNIEEYINTLAD
jgi:pectate lyase